MDVIIPDDGVVREQMPEWLEAISLYSIVQLSDIQ